jgi:hypothetical protein
MSQLLYVAAVPASSAHPAAAGLSTPSACLPLQLMTTVQAVEQLLLLMLNASGQQKHAQARSKDCTACHLPAVMLLLLLLLCGALIISEQLLLCSLLRKFLLLLSCLSLCCCCCCNCC